MGIDGSKDRPDKRGPFLSRGCLFFGQNAMMSPTSPDPLGRAASFPQSFPQLLWNSRKPVFPTRNLMSPEAG